MEHEQRQEKEACPPEGERPALRALGAVARAWGFWLATLVVWELALRMATDPQLTGLWPTAGFLCGQAGVLALLTGLPGRVGRVVGGIVLGVCFAVYGVQMVYFDIFGSLLSTGFVAMGGEAIGTFWQVALEGIWHCLPRLGLLCLPLIARIPLRRRGFFPPLTGLGRLGLGVCGVMLLAAMALGTARLPANATLDRWAGSCGLLTAQAVDVRQLLWGSGTGLLVSGQGMGWDLDETYWNVMEELDFDVLNQAAQGDDQLETLTDYFAAQPATAKNEYTGMFEGYNLIVVCAESFSGYIIDEQLTPTLYRLANGGIRFHNYYNTFPSLTTNGEYSLCTGLLPDLTRMSFAMSASRLLPFTLGNLSRQAGMSALAYHNNIGTFYNRHDSHPNMGYDFRAVGMGLDMEAGSPSSDLEMMEKSVDDYLDQEPFHVYYMSFSGHLPYNFTSNEMSQKNQHLVAGVEGSESYRAFLACQLELEAAMTYLVDRLEQAGVAERTVIVLTGDHTPYALPDEDYAQLAGPEAVEEPFWEYKNTLICWTPGLEEEPIDVDAYCSTIDVVPTLCNLFGFSYDSRLLAGRDVLAAGDHVAVLKDGSFLTDGVYYDGSTGRFTWLDPEQADPEREAQLLQGVENQFAVSAAILSTDYYRFAYSTLGLKSGEQIQSDEPVYADIDGTWYEQAVEGLVTQGALVGEGSGNFGGSRASNRVELVAMIARTLHLPVLADTVMPYTDLREGIWYLDAMSAAYAAGILPEQSAFHPEDAATQADTLPILAATARNLGVDNPEQWAQEQMDLVVEYQSQDETLTIQPGELCRGGVAWLVWQLYLAGQQAQDSAAPSAAP